MDDSNRLRNAVQDERARRQWAEQELRAEADRSRLWRERAEDRMERILRLEQRIARQASQPRPGFLRRIARRVRRLLRRPPDVAQPPAGLAEPGIHASESALSAHTSEARDALSSHTPAYPQVRVAVLGGDHLAMLRAVDAVDCAHVDSALYNSDLVFVTTSGLDVASAGVITDLEAWVDAPGRQPLVVWIDDEITMSPLASISRAADVLVGRDAGPGIAPFSPGFVPAQHNPIGWKPRIPESEPVHGQHGLRVWMRDGHPVIAVGDLGDLENSLRAGGVPILTSDALEGLRSQMAMPHDAKDGDALVTLAGDEERLRRLACASVREAYRFDTAAKRAAALLELAGVPAPAASPQVAALLVSNKPDFVVNAAALMAKQRNVDLHLVIGLHGRPNAFSAAREELGSRLAGISFELLSFDAEMPLGECLNGAAASCSSPLLAKVDDDDVYGEHYLEDAVAAMEYSNADVVGKARYFVHLQETNEVFLVDGPEEDFTGHVIGSSMLIRRSLWERVRFPMRPSRVDSLFLRGVRAAGARVYSNHHFEFGVVRRSTGHTWEVDPGHFAARGSLVGRSYADVEWRVEPDS